MSRKGGVGKTTITLALGSTFAMMRGDRVVALDANPDAGNLAHRVARPCPRTITDVLNEMELITSYSDLRRFTAQAPDSRLEVLASDDDPRIGLALNRQAYHRVIELLDHYYNLIVIDTGTGILDSANQGLLADADQLVLVLKPALDGARAAALTLDWLAEHGHGELVARAVVVINGTRKGTGIPSGPRRGSFLPALRESRDRAGRPLAGEWRAERRCPHCSRQPAMPWSSWPPLWPTISRHTMSLGASTSRELSHDQLASRRATHSRHYSGGRCRDRDDQQQ